MTAHSLVLITWLLALSGWLSALDATAESSKLNAAAQVLERMDPEAAAKTGVK